MKAIEKKKDSKMGDVQKEAKKSVVSHLMQMAEEAMNENLGKGLKEGMKVSVMGDDRNALASGLDEAKKMLKNTPMQDKSKIVEGAEDSDSEGDYGSDEEPVDQEASEEESPADSEHESAIAELEKKLAEMKSKKKA